MINTNKNANSFVIIVDRLEGDYAVCEFPDGTMCDVTLASFPTNVKDRERYEVFVNHEGNIQVLKKHEVVIPPEKKHKLPSRLIRF